MVLLVNRSGRNVFKICSRLCNTLNDKPVRVRFAPSPTGYLHLGGLRTALYNYLFALANKGTAIIRIEDTDQTRKVEGAAEALYENLKWAGIEFHEGPIQGGNHGPYVQSERCDIYKKYVKYLLENGTAYYCFCTESRLNILRRDALKNGLIPKYDNKCRHLTKSDCLENLKLDKPHCIRFKLSSDCSTFEDIIYGSIAFDISLVEGDPVIMKSDGFPTYHFANVVDDHLMEISHVLRGVEWQISTTKHLQLYKAFNWTPPQFGHLPLIMNADGTKLSKRQSDIRVEDYRKKGIFPNALLNYITFAGGGFNRIQGEGIYPVTIDDLVEKFDINQINSNSTRLNADLLTEANRLELKKLIFDSTSLDILVDDVIILLKDQLKGQKLQLDRDYIKSVLKWAAGRIKFLEDLISPSFQFLWVLPAQNKFNDSEVILLKEFSKEFSCNLQDLHNLTPDEIKIFIKAFCVDHEIAFNKFIKLLRGILSGLKEGPSVSEMMKILGKDVVMNRLCYVTLKNEKE